MQSKYFPKRSSIDRAGDGSQVPAVISTYPVAAKGAGDPAALGDLARKLWRGKWIVIPCALGGLVAGFLVTLTMAPTYRARTSMQIEAFNDSFLRDIAPVSSALPNASPENYLQNEVKLLESDTLAKSIAAVIPPAPKQAPGLIGSMMSDVRNEIPALAPRPMPEDEARIQSIHQALTVRTSMQSQVIELFYDASDPATAALGANTAASSFIALTKEARSQLINDTTDWLNKQAADLRAKVDGANAQLETLARSTGLVFAEKQDTLAEARMRQVQDDLAKAQADRAAKQARYESAANASNLVSDPMPNGPLRQYQIDLQTLQRQLAQLQTQFTSEYPKIQQLKAQIAEIESAMQHERTELLGRMRIDYIASASLERMLTDEHARQLKVVEQQMQGERRYETQKAQTDSMERLYETILQKAKEAGAASALRATDVRIIDPATTPSQPYSPKPPLNAAIGLALGLVGGIGIVFMRGESDRVKDPGDSPLVEVPELGVIPASRKGWLWNSNPRGLMRLRGRGEPGLVDWQEDASMLTESFRAALTSILFGPSARNGPGGRVLVVTSANMMEGKTTVIANLGIASAERKRRVLLVDADLRRPQLHAVFKLDNDRGLTTALEKYNGTGDADISIEDCIQQGSVPGLSVMTSGPAGSANLLYSSDLGALIERLRKEFDLVFIDTPPMGLYSDSRVLGRISDGVVMVVRADATRTDQVRNTFARLMQDQIPVIGTILNQWKMDPSQHKAYGRYYANYRGA
jgi:capsular exopolysaccharide synthesis family protein